MATHRSGKLPRRRRRGISKKAPSPLLPLAPYQKRKGRLAFSKFIKAKSTLDLSFQKNGIFSNRFCLVQWLMKIRRRPSLFELFCCYQNTNIKKHARVFFEIVFAWVRRIWRLCKRATRARTLFFRNSTKVTTGCPLSLSWEPKGLW